MSVPGRVEAAALLLSLGPPAWHLRHSRAVADVAGWLAARAEDAGRPLVEAAALLHDVDKALPPEDPARRRSHGDGSAEWLSRHGHPELAPAVASHPVTRLADERWFREVLLVAPLEVRIVAYADKRAGQRLEPMAERFASWTRRYPPREYGGGRHGWDRPTVEVVWARALELEANVCRAVGVAPTDVRRLAWTRVALDAAGAGRAAGPGQAASAGAEITVDSLGDPPAAAGSGPATA